MKVWVIPVVLPDPEKQPGLAASVHHYIGQLNGFVGFAPGSGSDNSGIMFNSLETARSAKWQFDEFSETAADIVEGTLSKDGRALSLHRVLKGG